MPQRPDLILKRGGKTYLIEVKAGRADATAVNQLCFYRDALARTQGLDEAEIRIVLAAKSIPQSIQTILGTVDGTAVELPPSLRLEQDAPSVPMGKTQVTTPKAWRVICTLLARPSPSIKRLHEEADVSYGWTHKTVRNLEELGVLGRKDGLLTVTDPSKLFNGIAWERPLRTLETTEVPTGFASVEEAGRELTRTLDRAGATFAFTAHTAAALYTGYAFRSDRFYLYTDDAGIVRDLASDGEGPILTLYEPGRDLEGSEEVEGIRLASKCQVLLDLAGMGPKAGDMTQAMVENLP